VSIHVESRMVLKVSRCIVDILGLSSRRGFFIAPGKLWRYCVNSLMDKLLEVLS